MKVSVRADVSKVRRALTNLQKQALPRTVSQTLNKTVQTSQRKIIKEAAARINVPQKAVRPRIRFQRRDKATVRKWAAQVYTVVSDLPMSAIGKPTQAKLGARVRGRVYPGSFVATMPSGKTSVWKRIRKTRFPIRELRLKIDDIVRPIAGRVVGDQAPNEFTKIFPSELKKQLKRLGLS